LRSRLRLQRRGERLRDRDLLFDLRSLRLRLRERLVLAIASSTAMRSRRATKQAVPAGELANFPARRREWLKL